MQPPTEETDGPGGRRTFLTGETLYLRGLEVTDATRAPAWHDPPFPIPAERAEEILKKELPEEVEHDRFRLVACRVADDEPVGSAAYQLWGAWQAWVSLRVDPAFGPSATMMKAELLRLVVPWLLLERDLMVVWASLDGGEPSTIAAAEGLGMRPAFRLRQALRRDGERHDWLAYEALHPAWVTRLGAPEPAVLDAPPPRVTRGPHTPPAGEPPRNAIMIGERVYLRPLERADAEQAARWSGQESGAKNGEPAADLVFDLLAEEWRVQGTEGSGVDERSWAAGVVAATGGDADAAGGLLRS